MDARFLSLGPVMLDLAGTELDAQERELLRHPAVGGVILFARNYAGPHQLAALTDAIHAQRTPAPLIAIDQEGGRVQRCRDGFTRLPPAGALGLRHGDDPSGACGAAHRLGWLMAAELRALGVDFSCAPVLDLDRGDSQVIGDRAFAGTPAAVSALARAWCDGVHAAGMATVGKHFPGHGGVTADSHHELPVDERGLDALLGADLQPFAQLIAAGALDAVMPAHVRYPALDSRPAGFSPRWLAEVLRERLGFAGAIISDDLGMAAAGVAGDAVARAEAALDAGCDLLLVCNDRAAAGTVVEALAARHDVATGSERRQRLAPRLDQTLDRAALHALPHWRQARQLANSLCAMDAVARSSADPTEPEGRT